MSDKAANANDKAAEANNKTANATPPIKVHAQKFSNLARLPAELLELVVANLDASSLLDIRATCKLLSYRVDDPFRRLLTSRKYFIHPYSLQLLRELSESHLAPCVRRMVIGTETFKPILHMDSDEYAPLLAEAFQRLPNLEAVEIRDFSTPYTPPGSNVDPWASKSSLTLNHPSRFDTLNAPYHVRWGSEPDTLRAQGITKLARQHGLPPREAPRMSADDRDPNEQLNDLFGAALEACALARNEAGVNITDFRVALVNVNLGIRDAELGRYMAVGEPRGTFGNKRFLSTLKVLHLPILNGRGLRSDGMVHLQRFLAACYGLKWLRLEFQETGVGPVCDALTDLCGDEEPRVKLELDRLDLGSTELPVTLFMSMVDKFKPRALGVWDVILRRGREPVDMQGENVWGVALREAAAGVKKVRLAHIGQDPDDMWQHVHFLPGRGRILEVPSMKYPKVSTETVEAVAEDMLFFDFDYSNWEAIPQRTG